MVAVYVTLGLGAVFDGSLAVRDLLRRGACRNAGQGNSGGQDENDETHGTPPLGRDVQFNPRHAILSHSAVHSRPNSCERWPSRLVATAAEDRLNE